MNSASGGAQDGDRLIDARKDRRAAEEPHAVEEWWRCGASRCRCAESHKEVARLPALLLRKCAQLRLKCIRRIKEWRVAFTNPIRNQWTCRFKRGARCRRLPTLRHQECGVMLQCIQEEEVGEFNRR